MGTKTNPKTEPETGPLKKVRPSEKKILCSKKESEMVPQKGGGCERLATSMLRCCFSVFLDVRAYFGTEFVHISEDWAFIFYVFLGSNFQTYGRGCGACQFSRLCQKALC